MNVAIITARAGSQSILHKNVYPILGVPCVAYAIAAAQEATMIADVFVTTDGEDIASVAQSMGCHVIWRPEALCGPDVNHGDVMKHAVERVAGERDDLHNVVVLIGNGVMLDGLLIDQALTMLDENPNWDSVLTVWQAVDDHPLRALEIHDGFLRPYGGVGRQVSTERQSYPPAYYFDQGLWAFRKECIQSRDGPSPWWWMGRRCMGLVRPWVAGRDIHNMLDVAIAEWWLKEGRHVAR